MKIKMLRYGSTPMGTFGELKLYDGDMCVLTCYTVEREWLDNKPFESCIAADSYTVIPFNSPSRGQVYAIVGGTVSEQKQDGFARYACLFHTANTIQDVVGCVGLGRALGFVGGLWAVTSSSATMKEFESRLKESNDLTHTLDIVWG